MILFLLNYYFATSYSSTYSATIHSLRNQSEWVMPEEILEDDMLPLDARRSAGRPRNHRIPSVGEVKKTVKCSRCGQYGHNKKTCKNKFALAFKATMINLQSITD